MRIHKENKNSQNFEKDQHEEYIKYMQKVENKKRNIKNFVKGVIATGLVVGTLVTGTACGINRPNDPDNPVNPPQTTTDPSQTTEPVTPIDPPKINESQKRFNEAIEFASQSAGGKSIDFILLQVINKNGEKSYVISLFHTNYDENGKETFNEMVISNIVSKKDFATICDSLNIDIEDFTSLSLKTTASKFLSSEALDVISAPVLESKVKFESAQKLDDTLSLINKKYRKLVGNISITKRKISQENQDYEYLFTLVADDESQIMGTYYLTKQDFEYLADVLNFGDGLYISIDFFKDLADSNCLSILTQAIEQQEMTQEQSK